MSPDLNHSGTKSVSSENVNDRIHLFVVHSMITYSVAKAIIKYRSIDPKNCVFILFRGFQLPDNCEYDIPRYCLATKYSWLTTYYSPRQNRNIRYIDRLIKKITKGMPFEVYLQNTISTFANLFVSNPLCIRYHLAEEGYSGFRKDVFDENTPQFADVRQKLNTLGNPRFSTVNRCLFYAGHEKFGAMYAIYEECFIDGGKNVVVLPEVFQKIEPLPYEEVDAFLVIDMLVQYRPKLQIPQYIQALDYLISEHFIPKGFRRVFYKSRKFEESEELGEGLERLTKQYASVLSLESLPNDCFFENMIYTYDAPVYYVQSSVGFYAGAMKKPAYTIVEVCGSFDPEWKYEFYYTSRNRMSGKAGIEKLPCEDMFGNGLFSVKQSVTNLCTTLKSVEDENG